MSDIQRILIVRTDRLGDVLLTLPVLPVVRDRYPSAHIAMLLSTYTGAIVQGNAFVDELIWYDDHGAPIPFSAIRKTLAEKKFDAAVVVHPTLRLALLLLAAGIPVRIGSGYRYYSWLFNRRVFVHRKDAKKHELEYNLDLLRALDCPVPDAPFVPQFGIMIPSEAEVRVDDLLAKYVPSAASRLVVLHPGSGGSAREWPLRHFEGLTALLARDRSIAVCVTGTSGETERIHHILRSANTTAFSLAGMLNLKELAALLRRASLVVGNSTGPLHLAVAVGTPVVGLYPQITPMSPRRWGPYTDRKRVFVPQRPADCTECARGRTPECACMASIGVEEVYTACMSFLAQSSTLRDSGVIHAS